MFTALVWHAVALSGEGQHPELQACLAEALYDAEAILSNPSAFKPEEIRTLRDQITSNLERAWEITGRSEDELTGVMVRPYER